MNNKYLIGIAFCIVLFMSKVSSCDKQKPKVDNIYKHVNEIVETENVNLDYSKVPFYDKPDAYEIGKNPCCDFVVIYPYDSVFGGILVTKEEAQKFINESTKQSLFNWENSENIDF
jgi:hypothetical protein